MRAPMRVVPTTCNSNSNRGSSQGIQGFLKRPHMRFLWAESPDFWSFREFWNGIVSYTCHLEVERLSNLVQLFSVSLHFE